MRVLGGDVWGLIRGEIWARDSGVLGLVVDLGVILEIVHQVTHFYLEEVLGRSVDLLEGLLS